MAEKCFELVPHDWDRTICVLFLLVLLPVETDPVPKERCSKKNLDKPGSSSSSKIVLTLLTKVVAVHVGLFAVYVQGTSFQLLLRHLEDDKSRGGNGSSNLQNSFKNLL